MTEKRREQSWIWLVPRVETAQDVGAMEEHLDANLRVEWAKSRARAARWTEEGELLCEEMRRTLVFLEWRAEWWRKQAHRRVDAPAHLRHGIEAYALRQAALQQCIANCHAKHWLPVLKSKGIIPCWGLRYAAVCTPAHSVSHATSVNENVDEGDNQEVEDSDDEEGQSTCDEDELVKDCIQDDYEIDLQYYTTVIHTISLLVYSLYISTILVLALCYSIEFAGTFRISIYSMLTNLNCSIVKVPISEKG